MFSRVKGLTRTLAAAAVMMAGAVALSGAASAQTVNFTGTTVGGFNGGAQAALATDMGLTFNGDVVPFNVTTMNGTTSVTLGSFTLLPTAFNYAGNTFQLAVTFTAPAGAGTGNYSANLSGTVSNTLNGVDISFSPTTLAFGPTADMTQFTLRVNNVSPNADSVPVALTGFITVTAVPAPIAGAGIFALLGLAGLVSVARRRQGAA